MFLFHLKDDKGKLYLKEYTKDKQACKSNSCVDCFIRQKKSKWN